MRLLAILVCSLVLLAACGSQVIAPPEKLSAIPSAEAPSGSAQADVDAIGNDLQELDASDDVADIDAMAKDLDLSDI